MNNNANNLLDDVLAEAAPADFRAATLDGTLRLVRRRRFRHRSRAAALLAVLALGGVLIWLGNPPQQPGKSAPPAVQAAAKSYRLVETRPLPASDIVTTRALAAGDFVASSPRIGMVQTIAGNYRVINDEQLLALLGNKPAILIRTGPHSEELVFANPEDEKGFPLN